jgi:hypothetical protein
MEEACGDSSVLGRILLLVVHPSLYEQCDRQEDGPIRVAPYLALAPQVDRSAHTEIGDLLASLNATRAGLLADWRPAAMRPGHGAVAKP